MRGTGSVSVGCHGGTRRPRASRGITSAANPDGGADVGGRNVALHGWLPRRIAVRTNGVAMRRLRR